MWLAISIALVIVALPVKRGEERAKRRDTLFVIILTYLCTSNDILQGCSQMAYPASRVDLPFSHHSSTIEIISYIYLKTVQKKMRVR